MSTYMCSPAFLIMNTRVLNYVQHVLNCSGRGASDLIKDLVLK